MDSANHFKRTLQLLVLNGLGLQRCRTPTSSTILSKGAENPSAPTRILQVSSSNVVNQPHHRLVARTPASHPAVPGSNLRTPARLHHRQLIAFRPSHHLLSRYFEVTSSSTAAVGICGVKLSLPRRTTPSSDPPRVNATIYSILLIIIKWTTDSTRLGLHIHL